MKIEETCPNCGAQHTVTTDSTEAFRISCGCGEKYLSFDARRPNGKEIRWMNRARPGNSARPRSARGRHLYGPSSGGRVVPKDIAEKLRKAYGGGTVTGRTSGGALGKAYPGQDGKITIKPKDAIQIPDSAAGELRFIDSKELKWGDLKWGVDPASSVVGHLEEVGKKEPPKKFEGHGAPDIRSKLVRQFQDVFGRDQ